MTPDRLEAEGRFDSFDNGKVLFGKKKYRLPAMGWNSWNAFGSGNTEELTKAMADKFIELGLDKLGYKYIVLDDGCYKDQRVDGRLSNEDGKFPGGFRALSDYIHSKGLKFGMYNDIGTNLCAGAEVGTCGHEKEDAENYLEWGVDFLKVDNCYYLWDNATFSNPENARYTFAPNIRGIRIGAEEFPVIYGVHDGGEVSLAGIELTGERASREEDYITGIGTFDGTGPEASPVGLRSSELVFVVNADRDMDTTLCVNYASGKREGVGAWLQVAVGDEYYWDDFLDETPSEGDFIWSRESRILL